ncbi:MAG: sigma-70 family RNA polymerase sigma factor [Dehalococcoidia bacterium]
MSEPGVLGHAGVATVQATAEELARRAVARDEDAWSAIFEAHYRGVYAFVRSRLHGAAEAEDLASQVFEVAFSRAHRFDYRGLPIEAWLIGIARNLVRDHLKKLGRRGSTEELTDTMGAFESDATDIVANRHQLTAAMRVLTEDQQTVLSLRFLMDRSVADTARVMRRSEDAVKNLQRRALASLKRAMEKQGVAP